MGPVAQGARTPPTSSEGPYSGRVTVLYGRIYDDSISLTGRIRPAAAAAMAAAHCTAARRRRGRCCCCCCAVVVVAPIVVAAQLLDVDVDGAVVVLLLL